VKFEEGVEDLLVRNLGGIEVELDNFRVASLVSADILIGGALERAALIADGGGGDSGDFGKGGFDTPETAGSECCFFSTHI